MCFSLGQATLLTIISYYNTRLRPFHNGYINMRKVQFPPLATSPSQLVDGYVYQGKFRVTTQFIL
jgi:hypothetical protein